VNLDFFRMVFHFDSVKALIIYVVSFALLLVAIVAGTTYAVISDSHNQSQWCATLELLTSRPVVKPADPARNPSRVEAYELYEDFVKLRSRFGCP
jgi:transketolase C-terminal domain/subunit